MLPPVENNYCIFMIRNYPTLANSIGRRQISTMRLGFPTKNFLHLLPRHAHLNAVEICFGDPRELCQGGQEKWNEPNEPHNNHEHNNRSFSHCSPSGKNSINGRFPAAASR